MTKKTIVKKQVELTLVLELVLKVGLLRRKIIGSVKPCPFLLITPTQRIQPGGITLKGFQEAMQNILQVLGVYGFFLKFSTLPMDVLKQEITTGMHNTAYRFSFSRHRLLYQWTKCSSWNLKGQILFVLPIIIVPEPGRKLCAQSIFPRGTGFQELWLLLPL